MFFCFGSNINILYINVLTKFTCCFLLTIYLFFNTLFYCETLVNNNKKALQAAKSDIEHLSDEIEENKRNTY